MAARLGNVLYWLGNSIAALLLIAWAIACAASAAGGRPEEFIAGAIMNSLFLLTPAAISFGIGRACRYVLAGT